MSKTGPDISKNKLRRVKLSKAHKYTFPPPQLYFDTSLIIRLSLFTSKPRNTRFFIRNFFSTQPQCCFTFSWIELQMLLKFCLIHILKVSQYDHAYIISMIILRHFLYLLIIYVHVRTRSIYVVSMWSIFRSHLHFHYY